VIASLDCFVRSGKHRSLEMLTPSDLAVFRLTQKLECGRLLDRQFGGYSPQNFVGVDRSRNNAI
jgi:hypothetical protein